MHKAKFKSKIGWLGKGLILAFCLWLVFILSVWALRHIAIAQIAEISGAKIEAESVDFSFDGSVFIKKLAVRPYQRQEYDDTILTAEKVYARFGLGSLLLMQPRLKEISVNDFVFNAQHDLDTGRWNIAALKMKATKGSFGKMPLVHLKNGTVKYNRVSGGEVKVAGTIALDAEFGPAEEPRSGYRFSITTPGRTSSGKSTLAGFWQPGRVTIAGGVSLADIPAFGRAWSTNILAAELNYDNSSAYSLKLRIKDLLCIHRVTPGTFTFDEPPFLKKTSLFTALQRFFGRYLPWGQLDIDLQASGNLHQPSESALRAEIYCKDVYICDRKFAYPVEHITGRIDFGEEKLSLNNLSGRHKNVNLFFNGWSKDFGPNWQYQIQVTSDNMALDKDLYNALSTKWKKLWSAFSPSGFAAINYQLSRRSQTDKKRTLAVELLDTEAKYRNFPYPLTNLTGKLLFSHDSITISDVVSQLDERKITLNGKVTACSTDRPIYEFEIRASNIPLDSTLAASLSDRQRYLYNRLNMAGLADAEIKVLTSKDCGPANFTANVSLKKTSLKAEDFPIAICDVSAKTVITADLIQIQELRGHYGGGLVSLRGRIWPGQSAEKLRYWLSINAQQVQLSDSLFGLLPRPVEKIAAELQPEGKINCTVDLNKAGRSDWPDYKIIIDCLADSANFKRFAYPLRDITGRVTVTSNSIKLEGITATAADNIQMTANASRIKINGRIALADNAFSNGWFRLCANDIFLDERLGIALPKNIQDFYFKLSPTGRFDLNDVNINISRTETNGKNIGFDGEIEFKNCNFNTFPAITGLNAGLKKIKGSYNTEDGFGNITADVNTGEFRISGKQIKILQANINYDDEKQNLLTENFVGDCYGGRLIAKFELKKPNEAALEYLLQTGFDNVDLKQFLSDTNRKSKINGHTSGKMSGSLSVKGHIDDGHSRIGRCRLQITDMQVGRVSPLAKLLDVLKLTKPKDFAFDKMLVDSYIKHDRLFLEKFDLSGESVAFSGSGWMDLESKNVYLVLTARGRRLATAEPSILQSLTEGLGHAVVRMDVTGDFYDPQVEIKTLPVIKDSLQILGTKRTTD